MKKWLFLVVFLTGCYYPYYYTPPTPTLECRKVGYNRYECIETPTRIYTRPTTQRVIKRDTVVVTDTIKRRTAVKRPRISPEASTPPSPPKDTIRKN